MDPVRNPYSPGAGRPPAALVGRDHQIDTWRVALNRIETGRTVQPIVLYGLRGVGKTVLLSAFTRAADARGWIVAQVEADTGRELRQSLGEALHGPLTDLARPTAGRRLLKGLKTLASLKASYDPIGGTWDFGLDLTTTPGGGADTGVLETDLTKLLKDLAEAAEEEGRGLAILIDEAQDLTSAELTALCSITHLASQHSWRLTVALAGLPSLPRVLAEAKSYAERLFTYERIEQLHPDLARAAITEPADAEHTSWDLDATDYVVTETSGYPYFLQQFGKDTWDLAPGPSITLTDAQLGAARARNDLDNGFFRARWDRATRAEQAYLRAMATDGDTGSSTSEVAARIGRRPSSFGPARKSLIGKGLIYAREHGIVAFTVPGMADFIGRQHT